MEKSWKVQYLKHEIQKHLEDYPFYTSKREVKPVQIYLPHISEYKMEKSWKDQYLKHEIQKHLEDYPFYTSKRGVNLSRFTPQIGI